MKSIRTSIEKVVINVGIGRLSQQSQFEDKILPEIIREVGLITGQKAAPRGAKKAISNFKTRVDNIIGLQVTLRGKRMEDFLMKIVNIVLPRVKDFRGLAMSVVDTNGNLNIGFKEQYVFPEIAPELSKVAFGLQVTAVPIRRDRAKALEFFKELKVPLKAEQ